ncbi:MAG: prolipoprotein diacylglyceryl transferase family protein [Fibrobacteria bacterium]
MSFALHLPPEWNGAPLPVHPVLEALAYFAGYRYFRRRSRTETDPLTSAQRLAMILAAGMGALLGSKLPGIWTWYAQTQGAGFSAADPLGPLQGKTLVGGILFAWLAVEAAKQILGIRASTGDAFIFPLCLAMIIGRLGCFLAGVADGTQGSPTGLPWGLDYGDGIPRHPAPLYEIGFLCLFWLGLWRVRSRLAAGGRFKAFILAYFGFRFAIDFLKPDPVVALGLSAVQWTALAGLALLTRHWRRYGGPLQRPHTGTSGPAVSASAYASVAASASASVTAPASMPAVVRAFPPQPE